MTRFFPARLRPGGPFGWPQPAPTAFLGVLGAAEDCRLRAPAQL